MLLHRCMYLFVALVVVSACDHALALEPNESFGQATQLAPGVLSVTDDLVAGGSGDFPDTMVASLNSSGFITDFNNDGGPWEGALGSALTFVPINNDSSFWFIVTGFDDFEFLGNHGQSGDYHVYVDIYDDFGFFEETHEFDGTLQPGEVDQFSLDEFNTNYTYDVFIDNTVGGSSQADVDFYTFTGLTAGAAFSAEVIQETFNGFNSLLGRFNDVGALIATDEDGGVNTLSLLQGTVPASGKLTFAVTGSGDEDFLGEHGEVADYSLELTFAVPGDFDNDGDVDGRDFLRWQRGGSPNPRSAGDLAAWQTNYGAGGLVAATVAVPEPAAILLSALAFGALGFCRKSR